MNEKEELRTQECTLDECLKDHGKTQAPQSPPASDLPIPLNGNIVVQGEKERKLASGLIVPEGAGPNYAVVISVGPGKMSEFGQLVKPLVSVGDRVLLDAPEGMVKTFNWCGQKYKLVQERFIAVILPGEDTFAEKEPSRLILPS